MAASRAIGPKLRFNISKSCRFVLEMCLGENGLRHRNTPMACTLDVAEGYVKCNIPKLGHPDQNQAIRGTGQYPCSIRKQVRRDGKCAGLQNSRPTCLDAAHGTNRQKTCRADG